MTATHEQTSERRVSRGQNMLQLASSRTNCCESMPRSAHSTADTRRTSQSEQRETIISRDSNMGGLLGKPTDESQTHEISVRVVPEAECAAGADERRTVHSADYEIVQITFLPPARESRLLSIQVSDVPHSDSSTDEGCDSNSESPNEQTSRNITFDSATPNESQNNACESETTQVSASSNTLFNSSSSSAASATDVVLLDPDSTANHSTDSLHSGAVSVSLDVESGSAAPDATSSPTSSPPPSRNSRQPLDPQAASDLWAGKLSPHMYAPPPYVAEPPPYASGADRRTPTTISELYRAAPLAFEMPPSYDSAVTTSSQQRSPRGRGAARNRSGDRSERMATASKCSAPRCGCWMLIIFVVFAVAEIITTITAD